MKVYIRVLLPFVFTYSIGIAMRYGFRYFRLQDLYIDLAFKAVLGIAFSFLIMPWRFVVASLFTVVVFLLVAGYLLDRTKNIILPISVHVVINMLHIFIQVCCN